MAAIKQVSKIIAIALFLIAINGVSAQSIHVGVTLRTIHFHRPTKIDKYNNWNFGLSVGYQHKSNVTIETAFVKNSYKKLTWVTAFGYRHGDWEAQIGTATGYKSIGHPWLRPGYFINYYADPFKIKLNHEIVNFGLTQQINLK